MADSSQNDVFLKEKKDSAEVIDFGLRDVPKDEW